MGTSPTVSAAALGLVLKQVSRLGLSEDAVLRACGLPSEAFGASLVERVSLEDEYRFWEALSSLSPDPLLHLRLASQTRMGDFFWGDLLFASSADVFTAIKFFEYFGATINESLAIRTQIKGDELHILFELSGPRRFEFELVEFGLVNFLRRVNDIVEGPIRPLRWELRRKDVTAVRDFLEERYGGKVMGGARVNRIVFPDSLFSQVTRKRSAVAEDAFREVVAAHAKLPGLATGQVKLRPDTLRSLIVKNLLSPGVPESFSVEGLAENLGVSERSLQRVFSEHQSSYRQTLLDVKMLLATYYLRSRGFTIRDVTRGLGYANESNFLRVFRKFFGTTPSRHRGKG